MDNSRIFVTGSNGQLGSALREVLPGATFTGRDEFDMTDPAAYATVNWQDYDTIINAAGMTDVDGAETDEGNALAQLVNSTSVQLLADAATQHDLTLVHVSSDYVFDGTQSIHTEDEPFAPLGNYGQSKADGDTAAASTAKHYIVRTTWVVGNGKNFVRSIAGLADRDISPSVVGDQFGRLTFTDDLAGGIVHLLDVAAPYGTYNLSNTGDVVSWADIARAVYHSLGRDDLTVSDTTAAEYFAGKVSSPRPTHSALDLSKIEATGFTPRDWQVALDSYLAAYRSEQ